MSRNFVDLSNRKELHLRIPQSACVQHTCSPKGRKTHFINFYLLKFKLFAKIGSSVD